MFNYYYFFLSPSPSKTEAQQMPILVNLTWLWGCRGNWIYTYIFNQVVSNGWTV